MPVSAPVPSSSSSTVAWNVVALPSPRLAAHTDTAVPPSISRPWPITPPAPQPIRLVRAPGPRGPPRAPPRAPRGCPPETNTTARSHVAPAELDGRRRRPPRAPPSRGSGTVERPVPMRTPMRGADDTARRAGTRRPYWPPCDRHRRVRAHRRRARPRSRSRSPSACASAGRTRSRSPPTRCRSTRACRSSPARRRAPSRRGSSTGCSASCRSPRRSRAGAFAERAHAEIDALLAHGRRPIVVGGTGLYLRAALADLDLRPPVDPAIRARAGRRPASRLADAARRAARPRSRGHRAHRPPAHPARARAARGRPRAAAAARAASCGRATPATRRCWPR